MELSEDWKSVFSPFKKNPIFWGGTIVSIVLGGSFPPAVAYFTGFNEGFIRTWCLSAFVLIVVVYVIVIFYDKYRSIIIDFLFPHGKEIKIRIEETEKKIIKKIDINSKLMETYIEEGIRRNLLARFLRLDEIEMSKEKINIIFSHRGEEEEKSRESDEHWGGKIAKPHNRQDYIFRSTSIPLTLEESSLIMQLWGTTYANTVNAGLYCSCEFNVPIEDNIPLTLKEHLILVGGSKTNGITYTVFNKGILLSIIFGKCMQGSGVNCFSKGHTLNGNLPADKSSPVLIQTNNKSIYFCPSGGINIGDAGVDYTLITRIVNPWNKGKYALVLAGCRSAGSLIIHFVLSNSDMLKYLIKPENSTEKPFALVLRVNYIRGEGLPDFKEEDDGNVMVEVFGPEKFDPNTPDEVIRIKASIIKDQIEQMRNSPNGKFGILHLQRKT